MTIDGAIKILDRMLNYRTHRTTSEQWNALKLGIEALKVIQQDRQTSIYRKFNRLPGETEEKGG